MSTFLLPLTLFLAVVFAASAIGKLRSADRGRSTFDALRIPVQHPDTAATALIIVEALVAIGLVATTGWLFVAVAVAALLLTASLLIVVARAHRLGATEDCGCFGDWLPTAIGPWLIVRNALLTVIAASVLAAALASAPSHVGAPAVVASGPAAFIALGAVGAALLIATAVWSMVRAATTESSSEGPIPRGAGAVLLAGTGEIVDVLAPATRAKLLVFVAPGCHACTTALKALEDSQGTLGSVADLYVVQKAVGGSASAQTAHDIPSSARFALDIGGSLGTVLEIGQATPVAAIIGTDGAQAGPLALGSDEVAVLIDSIRALTDVTPA